MIIIGGSGSGKTTALLNLIKKKDGSLIEKIYLYAKDLRELKYQCSINKRETVAIIDLNDSKTFMQYSQCRIMFTMILIIKSHQEKEKF